MRVRVEVRDGFVVLLAALWCMDGTNVLPLFLLAAAVHEAGHVLTLYLWHIRFRMQLSLLP